MFGLALVGDRDPPRISNRGVITESDLHFRTISLAAVGTGWIGRSVGKQGEV